jgi:hypothetical protein
VRKRIAVLAVSAPLALGIVLMPAVSAPQAHANCVSSSSDGKVTVTKMCLDINNNPLTPKEANALKDSLRDSGAQASGSQTGYGKVPK